MNTQIKIKDLIFSIFFLLIIPNLAFAAITLWLGDSRAIINVDYLLPLLLLLFQKLYIKIIGIVLFLLVFLIDCLLIVLQHFPTFHFNDVFYLLSFIFTGPKIFLLYMAAVIGFFVIELILIWRASTNINVTGYVSTVILLLFANAVCYAIDYSNNPETKFYNTTLVSSNTAYSVTHRNSNFAGLLGGDYLVATRYHHATTPWTKQLSEHKSLNKKLFLIIVESWGQPLNQNIQDDVLKNLTAESNLFDYYQEGNFPFRGFTVEGEMRELCQLEPTTLDLFKVKTGFQHCMPHQLNDLGYTTEAIHGGNSAIYGRQSWWPKAGFKKVTFQEDLHKPAHCIPFAGICDWDVFPHIKRDFAQDKKQFVYWMTLTSHYEYYQHDIHNKRFNCAAHGIDKKTHACRNLMLQAQLFDYIAKLMTEPEMRGVEVVIVGDHPPPVFTAPEIALYKTKEMKDGKVGWVHFRVKDNP